MRKLHNGLKAVVGSLFLVSLGKNSIITYQHIVIQQVLEKTKLLHLLLLCFQPLKNLARDRRLSVNIMHHINIPFT